MSGVYLWKLNVIMQAVQILEGWMRLIRICLCLVLFTGIGLAQEESIIQVEEGSITVDGNLSDWPAGAWIPVSVGIDGSLMDPGDGFNARASFAFDSGRFYLAVRVFDDEFVTIDRSWRYGDGFLFTIVTEEGKDRSRCVYQYGFSGTEKFLVFRNGEYFPRFQSLADLEFKHVQHDDRVDYEIGFPYRLLRPFNPFVYEKVALNIICADRDGQRRRLAMLSHDRDFDTEMTDQRAGLFFKLDPKDAADREVRSAHFGVKKNFFKAGQDIPIDYALNTETESDLWTLKVRLIRNRQIRHRVEDTLIVNKGLNRGREVVPTGQLPSGGYDLYMEVLDEQEKTVAAEWDRIFILAENTLEEMRGEIEVARTSEILAPSLPTLEVRLKWFEDFFEERQCYEDITALETWLYDILLLRPHLEKRTPLVFGQGTVKRYAHRSKIDNTLQPYSVYLPEGFDGESPSPLIVGLHGSGVDEQGFMPMLVSRLKTLSLPVIAPKGRGLSDYYVGDSGEDVFECVDHFTGLFPNIDRERILLIGFSMGGYGAWRLGLLRPDFFRGLIIMSGVVAPPERTGGEKISDMLDRQMNSAVLVVHGDRDSAVPVGATRNIVSRLRNLGVDVKYIEVPGAGHGNYEVGEELSTWIRNLFASEK